MPTVIEPPIQVCAPPLVPTRKRWTRAECSLVEAAGLWKSERIELIQGELLNRMGKNRPHANAASGLYLWLARVFGPEFVQTEVPIDVAAEDNETNEPEPDIIVLNQPYYAFPTANPGPPDLRLVVEVSDSTLTFDLTTKAALYARAQIAEYWVLDVQGRRLLVHSEPAGSRFRRIIAFAENEQVAPLASPGTLFPVAAAFLSSRSDQTS